MGAGGASPSSQTGEQLSLGCDRQVSKCSSGTSSLPKLPEGVEKTPSLISHCFLVLRTATGLGWADLRRKNGAATTTNY
ncbi:hypothetical protein SK128_012323 [Halocaridina rubra]|uniref:Uncharacterized protein n=1 Tax=Halocaridina rubra TaxID=373956 RepID=A0AAN8WKX2_HALRR